MSLLKTKPEGAIATKNGWVSASGELLVAITDLINKLKQELVDVNQRIRAHGKDKTSEKD